MTDYFEGYLLAQTVTGWIFGDVDVWGLRSRDYRLDLLRCLGVPAVALLVDTMADETVSTDRRKLAYRVLEMASQVHCVPVPQGWDANAILRLARPLLSSPSQVTRSLASLVVARRSTDADAIKICEGLLEDRALGLRRSAQEALALGHHNCVVKSLVEDLCAIDVQDASDIYHFRGLIVGMPEHSANGTIPALRGILMRRPGTVLKVPAISLLAALAPPNETLPVYIEYLRTDFALDEPRVVDSVATYSTRLTDRLWRLKEETPGQFADRLHGWCTGDSQKSKPQVWVEALSDQDPDVCVYGVNALALYVKGLPEDLLRGFRDSSTPNAQKTAAKLLKDWWEANQQRILPDKPGLWFVSPEDEETHR